MTSGARRSCAIEASSVCSSRCSARSPSTSRARARTKATTTQAIEPPMASATPASPSATSTCESPLPGSAQASAAIEAASTIGRATLPASRDQRESLPTGGRAAGCASAGSAA